LEIANNYHFNITKANKIKKMLNQGQIARENTIKRKHLISSLITGLIVGAIAGTPIGWFAHRFYYQQRLAQILVCRENNQNQPAAVVDSICGSRF
jgi:F0F1-type ATP synthase assembly protein I